MYGAMTELNMLTVWGIETQRALMDSGASGPMTALIKDHVKYDPPARKNVIIRILKSPNRSRRISDRLHKVMEAASAWDFPHLSPSLPKSMPKTAELKKQIEPRTPISKSL